ncbi:DNA translocase FtsK [Paracoccus sulfuroxidans]|uniref:DNA translocase FtsK n=1 Tax=Paracoccus sulfuroxidans TaxID=384678 RepID=A0A562N7L3_9RHOB|nr:DNA translocase FtsK [Paracoccus sulfuroxidans]TWI28094.1 DNA translocase FtsK [Paracoccus sulfuroxidans]
MASWQAKHRDPLFDQSTQAALERRGKELLGAGMVVLGVLIAMMLVSYSPDDPSIMSATDQQAQNYLGRFGAYIASALFMIAGYGAYALSFGAIVWGLRCMLHRGEERIMRGIFLPIAMVLVSVYATSLTPPPGWTQSFGLGGHLGDMLMGAMLSIMPIKASIAIKILALLTAVGSVAFLAFVLGFDRKEVSVIARFLRNGLLTARYLALRVIDRGANASGVAARGLKARADARRDRTARAGAATLEDEDDAATEGRRFLPRLRRAPEPLDDDRDMQFESELVERHADYEGVETPSKAAISARITDAIRLRAERPAGEAKAGGVMAAMAAKLTGNRAAAAPRQEPTLSVDEDEVDFDADEALDAPTAMPFGAATQRVVVPPARKPQPSRQAQSEAQPCLSFTDPAHSYECPPLSLLAAGSTVERHQLSEEALMENARMLEAVLDDYGVKGQITEVRPGPVVTLYELEPAAGLKASRVIGLADDIARSMSALSARVSTVPGRTVIGIELPNARREKVVLREILAAKAYGDGTQPLPLALGKDIGGGPVVANLAKMPHLLIAGTTGSGKSVAINTMILSLLYKLTPDECRLIMIDPKMLELSVYDGIPHLLSPVVTDPKKAVVALKWVVGEMEERYRKMSKMGVRNIEGYNGRVREALAKNEMFKRTVQTGFDEDTGEPIFETDEFQPETFPYIVVIVDEMADLMMVAGKEIEACIQRLAQMARASGIHLIMATQRPSVDVITGTIKANFPTRISFQVTSKIDSRTILGEQGAEQLLGQGDMLYMAGGSKITRVHGPFVSDEEVEEVVNHLKSFGPPSYMSGVVEGPDEDRADSIDMVLGLGTGEGGDAELYDMAVAIVAKDRKCSTSYIQRKLAIGYNKAARLVEQMEEQGIVSPANHVGKREVLVPEV